MSDWIDCVDKSINIDQWDLPGFDWNIDVPFIGDPLPSLLGPEVIDVSPLEFANWEAAGNTGETGMEHWQSCLNLMVHV